MTDDQQPNDSPGFIPPHGGYEKLKSYQMSVLVYDASFILKESSSGTKFPAHLSKQKRSRFAARVNFSLPRLMQRLGASALCRSP